MPAEYPLGHNDRIILSEILFHSKGVLLCQPAPQGECNPSRDTRSALKNVFLTLIVPLKSVMLNR